jgi:hypothetical protein
MERNETGGRTRTRTLDPLIKSQRVRVTPGAVDDTCRQAEPSRSVFNRSERRRRFSRFARTRKFLLAIC